jgi:hypothetical protein
MLFLAIGFAAVTTNLIINGTSKIGVGDVDVFFDNVHIEHSEYSLDGDVAVSTDKKTITFNTDKLDSEHASFVLGYDVRNASKEYDVNVTFNMNFLTGEELKDKLFMGVYNADDVLYASREDPSSINNNDTFSNAIIQLDKKYNLSLQNNPNIYFSKKGIIINDFNKTLKQLHINDDSDITIHDKKELNN